MKISLDHLSPPNNYFSSQIGVFLMQKKCVFFIYFKTDCCLKQYALSPLSVADRITVSKAMVRVKNYLCKAKHRRRNTCFFSGGKPVQACQESKSQDLTMSRATHQSNLSIIREKKPRSEAGKKDIP